MYVILHSLVIDDKPFLVIWYGDEIAMNKVRGTFFIWFRLKSSQCHSIDQGSPPFHFSYLLKLQFEWYSVFSKIMQFNTEHLPLWLKEADKS